MGGGERQLVRALFRALYRCAGRIEATAPFCYHTSRNSADMVLRGTLPRETLEAFAGTVQAASIACAEFGPKRAVRAAFDAQGDGGAGVDAALQCLASAHRVADAAACLAASGGPSVGTCEETAALCVARIAGASEEDAAAARGALDARAEALASELGDLEKDDDRGARPTLFHVLTALDAALFGGSRKPLQPCIGQFDDVASHRLDADVIAGDRGALPITLAVAAVAISRRAGLRGVFPVGAQGRFLVGVRGTGVDARDPPPLLDDDGDGGKNATATLSSDVCGDYLAEYGTHGKELVTVSRKGERLIGTKVSGDDHVPAGEVSFELDTNEGGATSLGRIRVAGPQFSDPTWRDVDAVAVSRDELTLESRTEPVALVLRRAEPDATSAVFLDAFGGGRMLTRHQLLRRTRKLDDDDDDTSRTRGDDAAPDVADDERLDAAPFPAAPPLEIARRMCRNLHAAAQRRNDRLDAMIWSHAELDFRAPNADQDAAR